MKASGGGRGGGSSRACYNCGSTDHLKDDCTEPPRSDMMGRPGGYRGGSRGGGGGFSSGPKTCFVCHKEGHIARECPEGPAESRGGY